MLLVWLETSRTKSFHSDAANIKIKVREFGSWLQKKYFFEIESFGFTTNTLVVWEFCLVCFLGGTRGNFTTILWKCYFVSFRV